MKIVLVTTLGKEIIPSGIVSAVLTQTAEVACDSLSIKIIGGKSLDEIERVYAYKNNKLIFNGYCDCQRTTADERGFETYIYARSSAKSFLIKYGEIAIKGKNRYLFEEALTGQIRYALRSVDGEF